MYKESEKIGLRFCKMTKYTYFEDFFFVFGIMLNWLVPYYCIDNLKVVRFFFFLLLLFSGWLPGLVHDGVIISFVTNVCNFDFIVAIILFGFHDFIFSLNQW